MEERKIIHLDSSCKEVHPTSKKVCDSQEISWEDEDKKGNPRIHVGCSSVLCRRYTATDVTISVLPVNITIEASDLDE